MSREEGMINNYRVRKFSTFEKQEGSIAIAVLEHIQSPGVESRLVAQQSTMKQNVKYTWGPKFCFLQWPVQDNLQGFMS